MMQIEFQRRGFINQLVTGRGREVRTVTYVILYLYNRLLPAVVIGARSEENQHPPTRTRTYVTMKSASMRAQPYTVPTYAASCAKARAFAVAYLSNIR